LRKKNKALSNVVGYVLLISITISLSVLVYGWLRFYVGVEDVETCSDNVNVIIRSYECFLPKDGIGGRLNITLKNKGLFTVDGYEVRVHDRENASFGIYIFNETGTKILPGEEHSDLYLFNESLQKNDRTEAIDKELERVTLVEVQPFMKEGEDIRCKSYASQVVECKS